MVYFNKHGGEKTHNFMTDIT